MVSATRITTTTKMQTSAWPTTGAPRITTAVRVAPGSRTTATASGTGRAPTLVTTAVITRTRTRRKRNRSLPVPTRPIHLVLPNRNRLLTARKDTDGMSASATALILEVRLLARKQVRSGRRTSLPAFGRRISVIGLRVLRIRRAAGITSPAAVSLTRPGAASRSAPATPRASPCARTGRTPASATPCRTAASGSSAPATRNPHSTTAGARATALLGSAESKTAPQVDEASSPTASASACPNKRSAVVKSALLGESASL